MSSLVGHDALVQIFNDIDLARTSALQLWEQVCMTSVRAHRCTLGKLARQSPLLPCSGEGFHRKAWADSERNSSDAALISIPLIPSLCMHAVMLCRPRRGSLP